MTALLVLHLLAISPSAALPERDEEPPRQLDWYGWQPFLADGTGIALWAGANMLSQVDPSSPARLGIPVLVVAGGAIYVFGGPAIHWGRQPSEGTALVDFGLRLLTPLVGGLAGFVVCPYCGPSSATVGVLIGAITAVLFDYAVLSWEPLEPAPAARASLQWAPFAGTACGEPVVGLAGTF